MNDMLQRTEEERGETRRETKMEVSAPAVYEQTAPNQKINSHPEWKKQKADRSKGSNRMAAFPGANVKFPRCRLKLERDEAKKMKERLSRRTEGSENYDKSELNNVKEESIANDEDIVHSHHVNGMYFVVAKELLG